VTAQTNYNTAAAREDPTKRKLTVTITKVRRHTVVVPTSVLRGRCPVCNREVEMLTAGQAAEFLEVGDSTLQALVSAGEIHAVETTAGTILLCKESLS
jgi:excisionase family DNA binding protein